MNPVNPLMSDEQYIAYLKQFGSAGPVDTLCTLDQATAVMEWASRWFTTTKLYINTISPSGLPVPAGLVNVGRIKHGIIDPGHNYAFRMGVLSPNGEREGDGPYVCGLWFNRLIDTRSNPVVVLKEFVSEVTLSQNEPLLSSAAMLDALLRYSPLAGVLRAEVRL